MPDEHGRCDGAYALGLLAGAGPCCNLIADSERWIDRLLYLLKWIRASARALRVGLGVGVAEPSETELLGEPSPHQAEHPHPLDDVQVARQVPK